MGRYNNPRRAAQNKLSANTPARARFSKGPPNKGRAKKRTNDTSDNDKDSKNKGNKSRNGQKPMASTARVIDKLQSRQDQPQHQLSQQTSRLASSREALAYVDKSKLDHLKLPDGVLKNITDLLEDLGVKEKSGDKRRVLTSLVEEDQQDNVERETIEPNRKNLSAAAKPFVMSGGYTEYDADFEEQIDEEEDFQDDITTSYQGPKTTGLDEDGGSYADNDGITNGLDFDVEQDEEEEDKDEEFSSNPAFLYLHERLSFSEKDASRACRSIQNWTALSQEQKESSDTDSIALCLDWLCLHLSENELTAGLRPNRNQSTKSFMTSKSGNNRVGAKNIKAIPHPSISLATDIVSDKAWTRSLRLQERVMKFVRLGFSRSEATQACEETSSSDENIDTNLVKSSAILDPALLYLLSMLRSKVCSDESPNKMNDADLKYAAEEREHEREALEAIYDDQFQSVLGLNGETQRYNLALSPTEELIEPARTEDCQIHIFVDLEYPVSKAPLILFENSSLPPSLLREINEFAASKAQELVGVPSVFELMNALGEALPGLQLSFVKRQKQKEFDAEQAALRMKAGHKIEQTLYDEDDSQKLGRRQKAKLKAAAKAYDRPETMQKLELERRQRQDSRIEHVQQQNSRVREVYAEQALKKREEERVQEESEREARAAMSAAFNRGESVEVARIAAETARDNYLKEYGPTTPLESDDPIKEVSHHDPKYEASSSDRIKIGAVGKVLENEDRFSDEDQELDASFTDTTPTTTAFMERLRAMYDNVANEKSGYHLAKAKEEQTSDGRTPCPIAPHTEEIGGMVKDILKQQEEQPWLISPEARVPIQENIFSDESLSPEQRQKQEHISSKLRRDLEKKLKAATDWDKRTQGNSKVVRGKSVAESYHTMMNLRQKLPAYQMGSKIVETISTNQVTVIAGDTGCGKTTQVPQLVLDSKILNGQGAATNIIVTQPRRISAIGVSERIAAERAEKVGETAGYSIKLEKRTSAKTRLLLCTTGVLLRRLQVDPDLCAVSHIFVDEVHERDLQTDFLLIILRDLLSRRTNLKLILMSATLNADAFSTYFSECPVVFIPGRTHPVKENRLEDILELTGYEVIEDSDYAIKGNDKKAPKISKSALRKLYPNHSKTTINSLAIIDENVINYELIANLLQHITLHGEEGAILVFMPGMGEITKTIEELYKKEIFQSNKVRLYPLHSSLTTAEQVAIFERPPPGVRKIVVSTNIAETSITIEDVVYVVDSGKVKENRRDEINETPTLVECWVSRASAKQRRGRAGRVRPGFAYHLFSTHTHDRELLEYQLPEMLRVGIEDLVLQVLILDLGEPSNFLMKALNPPSNLAMSNSLQLLESLGAVECQWSKRPQIPGRAQSSSKPASSDNEAELKVSSELTALGFHLATLPVDPRVAKFLIYGSLLGCVDPALTIAASMSSRSPFMSPFDQREAADEARRTFAVQGSDHLTILNAFYQWKELKTSKKGNRVVNSFLKENFLGRLTLQQMDQQRGQFSKLLRDVGFLPKSFDLRKIAGSSANANAQNLGLVKAVLCAGLYPNILVAPRSLVRSLGTGKKTGENKVGECAFQSQRKGEVHVHPSTIAFNQTELDSRYCCYHEIVKTSKTYARDTSTVSPFALLLFGGKLEVHQANGVVSVDEWLKFKLDAKPATLIKYLRDQMEKILLQKIINPEDEVFESTEGKALIESISIIFATNNEDTCVVSSSQSSSGGEVVRPWTGNDNDRGRRNRRTGGRGGRSGRGPS